MLSDSQLKNKVDIITNKLKVGLFDEVIVETKKLILKKKHQVLFNILSLAFQSKGEFKKSIEIMEEGLQKNPKNIYFLNNIGISYHKLDHFSEAENYFLRGLDVDPNYINIINNLGNLKKDLNQSEEAIKYYNRSLLIKDNLLETHINLSAMYQSTGQFEKSEKHLNKALEINPMYTEADRMLTQNITYDSSNIHFKSILDKISDPTLNNNQKLQLHFALGKCYEDIKDYKKSFINYSEANFFSKLITKYNINNDKSEFKKIKNIFTNHNSTPIKKNKRKIIFILGMPRSGTSLVEQIISSHHNVFGGGELNFISKLFDQYFLNSKSFMNFNEFPNLEDILKNSQEDYLKKISSLDNSQKVFTDKAPLNFKYIGFINSILPNSKIINCNRNPIDICWSNFKNYFSGKLHFTNNLVDLAEYYNLYQNLIEFWKKDFSKNIYDINYDNLVNDSENEIKKLLKFCELDWDPNCLKHENNPRSIKTVSYNQARKPIYKTATKSSDKYKEYLNELTNNINL